MSTALRYVAPAAFVLSLIAACGGASAPTSQPTGQSTATPASTATAAPSATAAPTATGSGSDFTALCRDLDNLTNLDYAFGKPFSVVQSLAADSKALTLQHLIGFASSAPPQLASAAADLVGLWTDLVNDPSSVSESDPRWAEATTSISTWRDANC